MFRLRGVRRSAFQFRLRSMLLIIAVVAAVTGMLVNRAYRQRRAVAALSELHASITYSHDSPNWLARLLGVDMVERVTRVGLSTIQITDTDMRHFVDLPGIEVLDLGGTPIGDDGIVHLAKLTRLRNLKLVGTCMTDAGLRHLQGLTNLEVLDVRGTALTDLKPLKKMFRLRGLLVGDTKVADDTVELTKSFLQLELLCLESTSITEASIDSLAQLRQLHTLNIMGTRISHARCQELQQRLPNTTVFGN